ncbi:hypothetical protein CMK22_01135 [Candidatus Poribacteria bacterium]|nr:hypothetical protein [Candidatus Poribacteria bacterium]
MQTVKIVIVGAGSGSFGRAAIADVLACTELNEKTELKLVLVDVEQVALDRMYHFSEVLKEYRQVPTQIEATTNRRQAFCDANYVITCVARDRIKLWEQDFYTPLAYGFRHIYGENGGPGAAFHTLRSLHLMMPIINDVVEVCPQALVLNFTNPESRICLAINKLTELDAVGICHGTQGTCEIASRMMGKEPNDLEFLVGGINHFHWILGVNDVKTGKDMMPALNKAIAEDETVIQPLARFLHKTFGLLTFPFDSHIGEYVGFAYDMVGPKFENYRRRHIRVRETGDASSLPVWQEIQEVADRQVPMTESLASPTTEAAVPIICAIELGQPTRFAGLNVLNTEKYVSNLPEDAVVEVPVKVDGNGIHPVKVGSLPEGIAAMCRQQISIQNLLVEAYAEKSKRALLSALLLEPTVDSPNRAEKMMEELLNRQTTYLPELR